MLELPLFLKGLLIGFSIAAPVGPIGILCIRRTLSGGRLAGLASGLGAASADGIYGSIAAFGLVIFSNALLSWQTWLRLGGGFFLCYLGIRTLLSQPALQPARGSASSWFGAYVSTFFLTLTNPMTILSFAAIFAGIGALNLGYLPAALLVVSIITGSAAWWLFLSGGVSLLRSRFTPQWMLWVNRLSGVIIVIFGFNQLAGLVFNYI
jgi:threonine/homoserine/homoserine lactone efflux protein